MVLPSLTGVRLLFWYTHQHARASEPYMQVHEVEGVILAEHQQANDSCAPYTAQL